jgi:hypothetical protein
MSSVGYHEPIEELSNETRDIPSAIEFSVSIFFTIT